MNIIFWHIKDNKTKHIGNFILAFSNYMSLITKINLFSDFDLKINNTKNINLILDDKSNSILNIDNKKINIFFQENIPYGLETDNILIIFLDLEKVDERYLFIIFNEIKKSQYNKFLFLPFKLNELDKVIETISLNFIYENIPKKNILESINLWSLCNEKKLEKILKKIREI